LKPASFEYVAARTVEEALERKARDGDEARFLAGGQSLVPAMNFRLAQPAVLIDINPIAALDYVRRDGNAIRIGALARYRSLQRSDEVKRRQPLLDEALPHVAHPQIRNRGTLAGNLSHADPASELPAVMLALKARMKARSTAGARWIDAGAFFQGALTTALSSEEMLQEIEVPDLPSGTGTGFCEVARRRGDYAMMAVAAVVTRRDGKCVEARIALCNAADTPVLATKAAQALVDGAAPADAAALVRDEIDPSSNVHASSAFRKHLAGVLTRRAVETAIARAA
jgi:aerobic carbon-monoxide dehydrogenase medium subunit